MHILHLNPTGRPGSESAAAAVIGAVRNQAENEPFSTAADSILVNPEVVRTLNEGR